MAGSKTTKVGAQGGKPVAKAPAPADAAARTAAKKAATGMGAKARKPEPEPIAKPPVTKKAGKAKPEPIVEPAAENKGGAPEPIPIPEPRGKKAPAKQDRDAAAGKAPASKPAAKKAEPAPAPAPAVDAAAGGKKVTTPTPEPKAGKKAATPAPAPVADAAAGGKKGAAKTEPTPSPKAPAKKKAAEPAPAPVETQQEKTAKFMSAVKEELVKSGYNGAVLMNALKPIQKNLDAGKPAGEGITKDKVLAAIAAAEKATAPKAAEGKKAPAKPAATDEEKQADAAAGKTGKKKTVKPPKITPAPADATAGATKKPPAKAAKKKGDEEAPGEEGDKKPGKKKAAPKVSSPIIAPNAPRKTSWVTKALVIMALVGALIAGGWFLYSRNETQPAPTQQTQVEAVQKPAQEKAPEVAAAPQLDVMHYVRALSSSDVNTKVEAIGKVAENGNEYFARQVSYMLGDPNERVRLAASEAILKFNFADGGTAIQKVYKDVWARIQLEGDAVVKASLTRAEEALRPRLGN